MGLALLIFLLAGMMILAGILRRTGFFQWIAIRVIRLSGGKPIRLLVVLSSVTAVLSAFLDNVTTVVLVAPVTLYVASVLGLSADPVPRRPDPRLEHRRQRNADR